MGDEQCRILHSTDPATLDTTVEVLGNDGIAALPTETVYGLGASVTSERGVRRVFETKGRPPTHPLIVHLAVIEDLDRYAFEVSEAAVTCARACWPGPLTMLVRRGPLVPDSVVGGSDLVAVRVPANAFTRSVIGHLGSAIAAPSANLFGRVSPTTARHVCADLGRRVDVIVDDGACSIGVESTIVDFTEEEARLVRPGGLPVEDLNALLGYEVQTRSGGTAAPGTLPVHYQPRAQVQIVDTREEVSLIVDELRGAGRTVTTLRHLDSLPMLASTLYAQLRQADDDDAEFVVAWLPPPVGLGLAIRDRLTRAAAR